MRWGLLAAALTVAALFLLDHHGRPPRAAVERPVFLDPRAPARALRPADPSVRRILDSDLPEPVKRRVLRGIEYERRLRHSAPATVAQLRESPGWVRAAMIYRKLPKSGLPQIEAALRDNGNPVVRQNLIFLAVLTLPQEISHPWLRTLNAPGDREDALVALAFDGDAAARREFGRLVSRARVHRLLDTIVDHEALGREGTDEARDVLRSYRAIEVLDHEPYFKKMGSVWEEREHPPALRRELLRKWLTVYPGHPGSDDMALRLSRLQEDPYKKALWASRAAAMPDQDVTNGAIEDLVQVAETKLTPEEIERLSYEQEANRTLLRYVRLRRIASERGFGPALQEADIVARDHPGSSLGRAWLGANRPRARRIDTYIELRRWDDPLPDRRRLRPRHEPLRLDVKLLSKQLEGWRRAADLERRLRTAGRALRAELLYELAAAHYHDRGLLWPVYLRHSRNARSLTSPDAPALRRAVELFELMEREHADYPRLDKVLFSKAMALKKLLDYGPTRPRWWEEEPKERFREVAEAFERCAELFPKSTLADDAERAARYWRSRE